MRYGYCNVIRKASATCDAGVTTEIQKMVADAAKLKTETECQKIMDLPNYTEDCAAELNAEVKKYGTK